MKKLYITSILAGMLVFSCAKQDSKLITQLIKGFPDTLLIRAIPTGITDPEISGFRIIMDSIAVFSLYPNVSYKYRAYNLNTLQKNGDFMQTGRGGQEFILPMILPQTQVKENGEIKIWVQDFPTKISLVNLSQTLAIGKTIVEKEYNFVRPGKTNMLYQSKLSFVIGDGVFLMNSAQERSVNADNLHPEPRYFLYNYNQDKCIDTLKYNYDFGSSFYLDKSSGKIVSTSPMEDLISIYDTHTKQETILCHSLKKPEEAYNFTNSAKAKIPDYTYSQAKIHNKLLVAAYSKNLKEASKNPDVPYYIHIFDTSGIPLHCLKIGEPVRSFGLDDRTMILYGLTREGIVYAYDLKDIIQ